LLNPPILYWIFIAFLFNTWGSGTYSTEAIKSQLATQRAIYSLAFIRLDDPSGKIKVDNARTFVLQLLSAGGFASIKADFTNKGMGDRFNAWRQEHRRRSTGTLSNLQEVLRTNADGYQKKHSLIDLMIVLLPACLPYAIRVVDGRDIFGTLEAARVLS
jgi:hypothetical protein